MPEKMEESAVSRPPKSFGSDLFWRLLATVILFSVLWILWLLWQITPKSAVNPIVFQIQKNRQTSTGTIHGAPGQAGDGSPGTSAPAAPAPAPVLSTGTPLENLKIETELKTPPANLVAPSK